MDFGSTAAAPDAESIGAVPHQPLDRSARPQLPTDDPFYVAPSGFQHAAPGTVLRSGLRTSAQTVPNTTVLTRPYGRSRASARLCLRWKWTRTR